MSVFNIVVSKDKSFVWEEYSSALLRIVGSTEQNKIGGGHIGDIEFGPGVAVETKSCSRTRGIVETFYTNVCRHCVGKAVGVAGHVVRTCRIKFYC